MAESSFNIYGTPVYWRETVRTPRLLIFDARLIFFFLLLILHLRLWTFIALVLACCGFWLIERYGYAFPNALRAIRSLIAGRQRPALPGYRYRSMIDYGFETREVQG